MRYDTLPYSDLSAVFCDELLALDAEMFYGATGNTFRKATELRKSSTVAEDLLWQKLRRKQLDGFRFRRQHPIGDFIADFYCHQAKLVIELDGKIHNTADHKKHDARRTKEMSMLGINIIRFTNEKVEHEIDGVLKEIKAILQSKVVRRTSPSPLLRHGNEENPLLEKSLSA